MSTKIRNRYSEELKTTEWQQFREEVIDDRRDKIECSHAECDRCGINTDKWETLHVHHKFYKRNARAWEYHIEDMMLLCPKCHHDLHDWAREAENIIVAQPPWIAEELITTLREWAAESSEGKRLVATARMRNAARNIFNRSFQFEAKEKRIGEILRDSVHELYEDAAGESEAIAKYYKRKGI